MYGYKNSLHNKKLDLNLVVWSEKKNFEQWMWALNNFKGFLSINYILIWSLQNLYFHERRHKYNKLENIIKNTSTV